MDYVVTADLNPIRLLSRPAPITAAPPATVEDEGLPRWARGLIAVGLAGGALWVVVKVSDAQRKASSGNRSGRLRSWLKTFFRVGLRWAAVSAQR